jgi:ubiquinone/menaquinone biosynthesis C-methylase UbiE
MLFDKFLHKKGNYEVRKYFSEIASQWDSMSKEFYSFPVRDKILSMLYPEPGHIIADIGSGTGFISEGLKNGPASIIAIDTSTEMLNEMKLKFRDVSNIDYRRGDANHLPAKDNIVDYALANMYLHHVDEPSVAINEIYRILTPGGKLILTDLEAHEFDFLRKEHHDLWLGFKHSEIETWFTEAGFTNVSVQSIEEYCCSTSVKEKENAKISIFLASGEKQKKTDYYESKQGLS